MMALTDDDIVLVAMKGDSCRAMVVIDDLTTCGELADTLREWHEFDPAWRPVALPRSKALEAMRRD